MHSLWLKLIGAFALIIVIGTGLVVILVSQTTAGQFELYITRTGQQWATHLAPVLASYYARTGTWKGVEAVLRNPWSSGASNDRMMHDGMMGGDRGWTEQGGMRDSDMMSDMWAWSGDRLILVQADGTVVADTANTLVGSRLPADAVAKGTPILLGERTIGTLIVTPLAAPATPASDFLGAVNRSALLSGLAAGIVAIGLGSLLFIQIIRPLRRLSAAALAIAGGDLSQRVHVRGRDEIGQVALTFNQMAEHLQRYAVERQNMIGDIAHELRTPLSVIQSNLEAMLDGVLPTTSEELSSLHQETLLLNRLITDLRTLSLAEAGQLHLDKHLIDLDPLVKQVVDRMRLRAEEKNMVLETHIAGELPQVQADPERLMQVITNLLDNALRYNPIGAHVTVGACASGNSVELSVCDNGTGVSPEDLPHLFERFWRAEKSRNRATGGSGLGLAIVKQLVEAHHGQVSVDTQPGVGTRFTVQIPCY